MSLLQLPPEIRQVIYFYAGAPGTGASHSCQEEYGNQVLLSLFASCAGPCPVGVGVELSDTININLNHRPAASRLSSHTSVTLSLLLSCSATYVELAHYIYSQCQIVIRAKDEASLAALRRLRASSIYALRRLTIDLNATSCGFGWSC
jgi:hypothetical protein